MSLTRAERFWAKVDRTGDCWLWTAAKTTTGYGQFWDGDKLVRAHRWSYERSFGQIPAGLHLDHLCRVRNCVRPSHLEPVTPAVNAQRGDTGQNHACKASCPAGHPYSGENLYVTPAGDRRCRECAREAKRRHVERRAV